MSLEQAFEYIQSGADHKPVNIRVTGAHTLPPITLTADTSASEVWLDGDEGAVIIANTPTEPLLTLTAGAPRVHLAGIKLLGAVLVNNARLELINVTSAPQSTDRRRLGKASRRNARKALYRQLSSSSPPALLITGGSSEVVVSGSTFEDHSAGAIVLAHGHLVLTDSVMQRNLAVNGGAMRVSGGHAEVSDCRLEKNDAIESGGALHIDGGEVELSNRTVLLQNSAPSGKAIDFTNGSLSYSLPVPIGRWLLITTGTTLALEPSEQNSDYPFACSPGLVGDSFKTDEQNGPWCSRACDAGYHCPSATSVPLPCGKGTYCEQGSSAPTACEDGTWSNTTLLTRQEDCMECPAGQACSAGEAVDCAAGSFTNEMGQSECTPCASGSFQSDSGQTACVECTAGETQAPLRFPADSAPGVSTRAFFHLLRFLLRRGCRQNNAVPRRELQWHFGLGG